MNFVETSKLDVLTGLSKTKLTYFTVQYFFSASLFDNLLHKFVLYFVEIY